MSHEKKRGFTLIELLAVIIVVAVIALITVPIVTGYIESSRKKAFTNSVYHGMQSIDEDLANQDFAKFPESGISAKNELVNIERNPFIDGKFLVRENEVWATRVTDGRYCAKGTREKLKIVLGDCYLLDDTPPEIDAFLAGVVTSNSIQVTVKATDLDSDIISYEYSKDGGKTFTNKMMNTSYTFTNLTHNTSFNMVVRITNQNKLSSTKSITLKTLLINTPTFSSSPALGSWSPSKVVTITYPGTKQSNYIYEYRKDGGAWTTVSGMSQNVTFTANGTLEARVRDGYNTVNASTLTITTIDTSAPGVPTSVVRYDSASGTVRGNSSSWTNRTLWWGSFSASDTGGSGIDHYEYSQNCTGSKSGNLNSSHTYSNNTNYTFCIRAVDKAGNVSGWSGAYYFRVDKSAPTCSSSGSSGAWTNGNITLSGVCSDTGGSGCTGNVSRGFTSNTNGSYSPGTVYDGAGNGTTCPSLSVKIDKTPPSCSTTGGTTSWVNTVRTITGNCSDTGGSGCRSNVSASYSSANGSYSPGTVYDNAGNGTWCSNTTLKVDTEAPYAPKYNGTRINSNNTTFTSNECTGKGGGTANIECNVYVRAKRTSGFLFDSTVVSTGDRGPSGVARTQEQWRHDGGSVDNCPYWFEGNCGNWTAGSGNASGYTYIEHYIRYVDAAGNAGPYLKIRFNMSWY